MHRLRSTALAFVLTAAALVVAPSGSVASNAEVGSATAAVTPLVSTGKGKPRAAKVRVGTFNIKNVVFDRDPKRMWPQRRAVIVRQVLNNRVGLLGIQEAQNTPVGVFRNGWTQYLDLKAALNKAGGNYRLTARAAVNCKNAWTPYRCEYRDRGASRSTRILYDASRFDKLDSGAIRYRRQAPGEDRFLVWGKFRSVRTGQRFLFTTTHITSRSTSIKVAQWRQMISGLQRLSDRGRIPVIATGDMNASKYNSITKSLLPAIKSAGFGDILNQRYLQARIDKARAKRVVRAWISSYNRSAAKVSTFGHEENHDLGAGHLDYIFASNRLPVREWKQVISFNRKTLAVRRPTPSDHNLITATVVLPR